MKSFTFIAIFLVAPSVEFPAANLLDGLQQVRIQNISFGCDSELV